MADSSGSDTGGDRVKTHRIYVCEDSLEGIFETVKNISWFLIVVVLMKVC